MTIRILLALGCLLALATACAGRDDKSSDGDAPDANADSNTADAGPNETFEPHTEAEPNGGDPLTDVNPIEVGWAMAGAIGTVGDADVYQLNTQAGHVYRLELTSAAASEMDGVLTVLDSGRNDEPPGEDFVKVSKEPADSSAVLEFIAFGDGHYIIVRDQHNIGGATVGGAAFTYALRVREIPIADRIVRELTFPAGFDDALDEAGGINLYSFNVDMGTDIEIDLDARDLDPKSDIDSRMTIWSKTTGTWGARNDDEMNTEDSFIAAPLPIGGDLYLLVENVESVKPLTDLRYHLTATLPN